MNLSQLTYTLPTNLIAHSPSKKRDCAKMLVIERSTQSFIHKHFYDLVDILGPNDVLVFNKSKVIPARLFAKKQSGGSVEILLTKPITSNTWEALHKNKLTLGATLSFGSELKAEVIKKEDKLVYLQFNQNGEALETFFEKLGQLPLPPYIQSKQTKKMVDERYQTVYATDKGSIAAPTAGLHFTDEMLKKFSKKGVQTEFVTLHVGLGTFLPIKIDSLSDHIMHKESFRVDADTAKRLSDAKQSGKRIIAVGTTTTRVLETIAINKNSLPESENQLSGETQIFIYPPYQFKFVDALITNFHLSQSTLLALVSAFVSYPNTDEKFSNFKNSIIGRAYQEAIDNQYRFYSFGDGCLII